MHDAAVAKERTLAGKKKMVPGGRSIDGGGGAAAAAASAASSSSAVAENLANRVLAANTKALAAEEEIARLKSIVAAHEQDAVKAKAQFDRLQVQAADVSARLSARDTEMAEVLRNCIS